MSGYRGEQRLVHFLEEEGLKLSLFYCYLCCYSCANFSSLPHSAQPTPTSIIGPLTVVHVPGPFVCVV